MEERPRLVLLVGLPGAGKSTWLAREGLTALSSDHVRHLLSDDEDNQNIHRQVFATLRYLVKQRLALGTRVTYIDATNLTPYERRPWVKLAQLHDCAIEAVYFDTPLEVCLERNAGRARVVPEEVIRRMARRMRAPEMEEGFQAVRRVQ